jgi:hypothetical protein
VPDQKDKVRNLAASRDKGACLSRVCDSASSCQMNSQGQAICVPHLGSDIPKSGPSSCSATLCANETAVCIETTQGPRCIKDPCPSMSCLEGSVCQMDGEGNAICTAINPPTTTCQLVDCPADRPICTETEQGPICIAFDCTNTHCEEGEICFERTVLCKKAPCLPIPECITDPCRNGPCPRERRAP